jgi:hypothetical protein
MQTRKGEEQRKEGDPVPENSGKTVRGRPFKKGQSGNPGGRPKQTQEQKDALAMIKELAPVAVERLGEILRDKHTKPETLLRAIEMVLDRVYGKPTATEIIGAAPGNELLKSLLDIERGTQS